MKRISITLLLPVFCFLYAGAQQKIMGFTDERATAQLEWEKKFDAEVKEKTQDEWMRFITSRPHHLGSPQGKINAEYIAGLFRSWGYETAIETYYVLFPTPKKRVLALLGAKPYKAKLQELTLPQDRTSGQKNEQLPTYNAYSADGDVTAPLVFVNRGLPADYEELKKMGVDVKGKIVIAKYGGSWRGLKPKFAAEHGAIGCIIYSDPLDDGYGAGDVYPEGPFRPESGVQRGSVMDWPVQPADPLTPGVGATKTAKRLDRKDAITLMKIPVLPISYEDALPLMKSLRGPVAPASWRGGLPITYHVGPGTDPVHLQLEFNWDTQPAYDVIARIKGSELPDEWVIRGNHHDAWVNGAEDPVSAMVSEMEEARVLGELFKKGYVPKRTMIYCAWDGEEEGMLGSGEWAEDHQEELKDKAVFYLNTDGNGRGFISSGGSHSLEPFFNEIADEVKDPQTGVSIKERRYAKTVTDAGGKMLGDKQIKLDALGAGSDWSGFLQYLGITTMNLAFEGEDAGGEYHSIYDSYDHFVRFKDPGFHYGSALSKTAGRVMMRMANADVLPIDYKSFTKTVSGYVEEIKSLVENMRMTTDAQNKMIADKLFDLAKDPTLRFITPEAKEAVPYLNFSGLENSLSRLKASAEEFKERYPSALLLPVDRQKQLNEILYKSERSLLTAKGLPRRPWYKHQVYAPGIFTGYGVKTLPGIREGVEERNWKEAQENIAIVAGALDEYTKQVEKAINTIKGKL